MTDPGKLHPSGRFFWVGECLEFAANASGYEALFTTWTRHGRSEKSRTITNHVVRISVAAIIEKAAARRRIFGDGEARKDEGGVLELYKERLFGVARRATEKRPVLIVQPVNAPRDGGEE